MIFPVSRTMKRKLISLKTLKRVLMPRTTGLMQTLKMVFTSRITGLMYLCGRSQVHTTQKASKHIISILS